MADLNQQQFNEEQLRLQAAALQAANAIVVTDAKGTILWINRAFTELTGYAAEECIGQNPRMLKSGDHEHSFYENLWSTIRAGGVWRGEIKNRKKDGSSYIEEMTITPLVSSDGKITNFVGIKQDITEKKKLEAQYRHAQKMEAVGRLAGGIAHDFNNVLSIISGYSDISLDKLPANHPVARNLHQIKVAAQRASSLTKQLLAYSRQQIVFPKPVDLNALVNNAEDMVRRLVGEDVGLTFRPGNPIAAVKLDVGQFEQVLMNLVVNARDAMPHGGEIVIETHNVELDETYRRTHEPIQPGSYVMLSVSDSGCGMDGETKARIFEPFFTTKENGRGTGLGLSMVYAIVKQNGGYIWAYSEPGQGTTFKLFFPRIAEPVKVLTKPVETAQSLAGSESILLVEDHEGLREVIAEMLRDAGYTVFQADGPQTAIGLSSDAALRIHLLLSDIVMPQISGIELFELLKRSSPNLRAIFMSGYASQMLFLRYPIPADTAFLEKPFSRDALLLKIRRALDDKVATDEGAVLEKSENLAAVAKTAI